MSAEKDFYPAPFDFHFEDVWMLEAVRGTAMHAYKMLHEQKHIVIRYPVVATRSKVKIKYDSQLPRDWTLSMLKEAEEELNAKNIKTRAKKTA